MITLVVKHFRFPAVFSGAVTRNPMMAFPQKDFIKVVGDMMVALDKGVLKSYRIMHRHNITLMFLLAIHSSHQKDTHRPISGLVFNAPPQLHNSIHSSSSSLTLYGPPSPSFTRFCDTRHTRISSTTKAFTCY